VGGEGKGGRKMLPATGGTLVDLRGNIKKKKICPPAGDPAEGGGRKGGT